MWLVEGGDIREIFGVFYRYSPMCIDAATVMLGVAEGRNSVLQILGSLGTCPLPQSETATQKVSPNQSSIVKTTKVVKVGAS